MGCEQWREVLSAQLDGEDTPGEQAAAESHLTGCGECRAWFDRAAAATRRARLSVSVTGPDLTESVLAALPSPARSSRQPGGPGGSGWRSPCGQRSG